MEMALFLLVDVFVLVVSMEPVDRFDSCQLTF